MTRDIFDALRLSTSSEEFDYLHLMQVLKDYKKPRDVVSRLLREGSIIRVKKGLYVFGDKYIQKPRSLEILANLIYGPSYLSFEYALSFYGLIPERVYEVSSATINRTKSFDTPLGLFSYTHVPLNYYKVGLKIEKSASDQGFLIAKPEKAISDVLIKITGLNTNKAIMDYLLDGMRMEREVLMSLDIKLFEKIAQSTSSITLKLFLQSLRGLL